MNRFAIVALTAAAFLGATPAVAHAQYAAPNHVSRTDGRLTIEGFMSRHRLETSDAGAAKLDGLGGRLMWSLAPADMADRGGVAARTALGAFAVRTAEGGRRLRAWHYGAQADFRMTSTPLGGRLEPLVSLGVGAFRTEPISLESAGLPALRAGSVGSGTAFRTMTRRALLAAPAVPSVTTRTAFTPGIGAKLAIGPGMAVRADVRDAIVFRDRRTHNVEVSAGFSLKL